MYCALQTSVCVSIYIYIYIYKYSSWHYILHSQEMTRIITFASFLSACLIKNHKQQDLRVLEGSPTPGLVFVWVETWNYTSYTGNRSCIGTRQIGHFLHLSQQVLKCNKEGKTKTKTKIMLIYLTWKYKEPMWYQRVGGFHLYTTLTKFWKLYMINFINYEILKYIEDSLLST